MSAVILISKLNFDEIPKASTMLAQCWKIAYKGLIDDHYLDNLKNTHWVQFLEDTLKSDTDQCFVAKISDEIIGVLVFGKSITEKYPHDGEVVYLYVHPSHAGKSIGKTLLKNAQQLLKHQGYKNCIVCTFKQNDKAIAFYKANNYKIVSKNELVDIGQQEIPYVIMRKLL